MYKPKTEYLTIVTAEQLNTVVPDFVCDFMGYEKGKGIDLKYACYPESQELEDGTFLINIQLTSAKELGKHNVNGFITEAGYNLAVQFYGEENIFEDISQLNYKTIP